MHSLEKMKRSLRWNDWAQGKVTLFSMIIFYLILKNSLYSIVTIKEFLFFLIFIMLVSIYGYLINDLFDVKIDRLQGKKNVFEKTGSFRSGLIVFMIFLGSALFGWNFVSKYYFVYLAVILYFFATFYSAPPIRFKERGAIGLAVAFLTQYPIPIVLIFSCFDRLGALDMWGIVIFSAIRGAAIEIAHQRSDLKKDRTTGTKTFAAKHGQAKLDGIYKIFLYLDMASMFGILIIMTFGLRDLRAFGEINVMLPLLILYLIMALMVVKKIGQDKSLVDPYFVGTNDIFHITYTLFPNCLLPFYLSCLIFLKYPMSFVLIAIFLLITFVSVGMVNITWPVKVVYDELRKTIGER